MTSRRFPVGFFPPIAVSFFALALTFGSAAAQNTATPYEPKVGQQGKDVVWVPTPQALVDRMLDMARVTVDDYVVDLGSGDGRTVITAARRGARARGIEFNPDMVELSRRNAAAAGVGERATFVEGDIFRTDFSDATVVTMFLLPELNRRLRPLLLEMKPGTRLVSNTFDMGDWVADQKISAGAGCTSYCQAFLWIVPATFAGTWQLPDGGELKLEQKYQMVTGTLTSAGKTSQISNGKVEGDRLTFTLDDRIYSGRFADGKIEGVVSTEAKWQATRR